MKTIADALDTKLEVAQMNSAAAEVKSLAKKQDDAAIKLAESLKALPAPQVKIQQDSLAPQQQQQQRQPRVGVRCRCAMRDARAPASSTSSLDSHTHPLSSRLASSRAQLQPQVIELGLQEAPGIIPGGETQAVTFFAVSVVVPASMAIGGKPLVSCTFRRNNHFKKLRDFIQGHLNTAEKLRAADVQIKGQYAAFFGPEKTAGSAKFALNLIKGVTGYGRDKELSRLRTFSGALPMLNVAYSILADESSQHDVATPFMFAMAEIVAALDDFYYPLVQQEAGDSAFRTLALGWARRIFWAGGGDDVFHPQARFGSARVHTSYTYARGGKKSHRGLYDADVTGELINQWCFPNADPNEKQLELELAKDVQNV